MKLRCCLLVALNLVALNLSTLAAPPALATASGAPFVFQAEAVTRRNANLRAGSSLSAKVLLVIPRGQTVQIGRCGEWCPVKYRAGSTTYAGYLYTDLLRRRLLPIVMPHQP